ncbi:MAG: hypothetical protein KYX62_01435 [Pseudomonadota bacterium]|nr:hypothetical protein [Pseudomonadota bacterium]
MNIHTGTLALTTSIILKDLIKHPHTVATEITEVFIERAGLCGRHAGCQTTGFGRQYILNFVGNVLSLIRGWVNIFGESDNQLRIDINFPAGFMAGVTDIKGVFIAAHHASCAQRFLNGAQNIAIIKQNKYQKSDLHGTSFISSPASQNRNLFTSRPFSLW